MKQSLLGTKSLEEPARVLQAAFALYSTFINATPNCQRSTNPVGSPPDPNQIPVFSEGLATEATSILRFEDAHGYNTHRRPSRTPVSSA